MYVCQWCRELSLDNEFSTISEAEVHSKLHASFFPEFCSYEFAYKNCFRTSSTGFLEKPIKTEAIEPFKLLENNNAKTARLPQDPNLEPEVEEDPELEETKPEFLKTAPEICLQAKSAGITKFQCKICFKKFDPFSTKLVSHTMKHVGPLPLYTCLTCGANGQWKWVSNHCAQVHSNKKYRDDRWKFDDILTEKLKEIWLPSSAGDSQTPTPDRRPRENSLSSPSKTKRNHRIHKISKKCTVPKKFRQLAKMAYDRLTSVKNTKLITCLYCLKRFPRRTFVFARMENHVAAHCEKKLFDCKLCDYSGNGIRKHFIDTHPGTSLRFVDKRSQLEKYLVKALDITFPVLAEIFSLGAPQRLPDKFCSVLEGIVAAAKSRGVSRVSCNRCSRTLKLEGITGHCCSHSDFDNYRCGICGMKSKARSVTQNHLNNLHDKSSAYMEDLRHLNDEKLTEILEECFGKVCTSGI